MRMYYDHPRSPDYWIMKNKNTVWDKWLDLINQYPNRFIVGSDNSNHSTGTDDEKMKSVSRLLRQITDDKVRKMVATENLETLLKIK